MISTSTAETQTRENRIAQRPTFPTLRVAIAAVVATVLNLIVYAIGSAAEVSWDVGETDPVPWFMVVIATLLPFGVGAILTWLISRKKPGAIRVMAWAGLTFAVASTASSLMAGQDTGTVVGLSIMHLIPGVAWAAPLLLKS